jgi:signal peptidase I
MVETDSGGGRKRLAVFGALAVLLIAGGVIWATASEDEGGLAYRVPSEGMDPTFEVGQIVQATPYDDADPQLNDIVVFYPPLGAERGNQCGVTEKPGQPCPEPVSQLAELKFLKRVVALPGDRVRIEDGYTVVDGVRADEPFTAPCTPGGGCNYPVEMTVPPDHYFVLGDNRPESDDSRYWGPVPRSSFIGWVEE